MERSSAMVSPTATHRKILNETHNNNKISWYLAGSNHDFDFLSSPTISRNENYTIVAARLGIKGFILVYVIKVVASWTNVMEELLFKFPLSTVIGTGSFTKYLFPFKTSNPALIPLLTDKH